MLWESDRHESLVDASWDDERVAAAIREIAADTECAYSPATLWPMHPLDGPADTPHPRTSLYFGASGVAWALLELERRGAITTTRDWRAELPRYVEIHLATPELGEPTPSLFLGEVGIRAIADVDRDRLHDLIANNIENPSLEAMWGAPGTMLPALRLFERTGETRWRDLYLRNVDHLLRTLTHHPDFDVWMWTQDLYGEHVRLLGAGHGFAGNMYALLRGRDLLSADQHQLICDRAKHTLRAVALHERECVNWLPHVGASRKGRDKILVQWCHGAPGMIVGLARLPLDEEVDTLFAAAGETIWSAGPLVKGAGLCHGTAGNGWAFLVLHARTRDPRWLERARRFALHALQQVGISRGAYERGRYSLWTGDLGVALFAQACRDGALDQLT
jgi:hypothetical protein